MNNNRYNTTRDERAYQGPFRWEGDKRRWGCCKKDYRGGGGGDSLLGRIAIVCALVRGLLEVPPSTSSAQLETHEDLLLSPSRATFQNSPLHSACHTSAAEKNHTTTAAARSHRNWVLIGLRCVVIVPQVIKHIKKYNRKEVRSEWSFLLLPQFCWNKQLLLEEATAVDELKKDFLIRYAKKLHHPDISYFW